MVFSKSAFLFLFLIVISLTSCRSLSRNGDEEMYNNPGVDSIRYRLIYYVHGDGSYLFHDNDGNEVMADDRMVQQAISVALALTHSEVFIFHQKPKKHFLFFFPRKDGEFFYYRNGKLIANESYNSNPSLRNLEIESVFFHEYASYIPEFAGNTIDNFFLYYGHEIPESDGRGYNMSYPEKPFSIENLSNALALMINTPQMQSKKFDMVLLSTCYNGTPGVISRLAHYTHYVIASPEYLHLSYISSSFFKTLAFAGITDMHSFLKNLASEAFYDLKSNTQTMITVSLYDVEKLTPFLKSFTGGIAGNIKAEGKDYSDYTGCIDCAQNKTFDLTEATDGIDLFYNPPQFGKYKNKLSHSGWGCPK